MSLTAQQNQAYQNHARQESDDLNDDVLARMSQAVNTAQNLDQLLAAGSPVKTQKYAQYRQTSASPLEGQTPATELPARTFNNMSSVSSPRIVTVKMANPTEHLDSSDEEECTFQPKINASSARIRNDTTDMINENLYKDAADRKAKLDETREAESLLATQKINSSKSSTKSMKIVLQKTHKALSSLIKDAETSEYPGELNFEGLGTVLHRLGIFQNLEFSSNSGDGEKSSLSINHARIKPERLAKEIAFHENLWSICALASIKTNFIFSDLVLRVLMTLVEDKTQVNDAATLLLEILDAKLESIGMKSSKEKFVYHELKEKKNLWSMEKLVLEFRRLFNDKTSFMNTYSSSSILKDKSSVSDEKQTNLSFRPEINKKSIKLDSQYFNDTLLKKIGAKEEDVQKHNLTDRNHRLNHYHKYLQDSKTARLADKCENELNDCSFSPKIKNYKNFKNDTTMMSGSLSPRKTDYFSQAYSSMKVPDRHSLLYQSHKTYKEKLHQQSYKVERPDEIDDVNNCTFKPKLNDNYNNSPTRLTKFNEGLPNGYKKNVERVSKAVEDNQNKKAELESIPRGENYEKNRAAEFNAPKFINRPKVKAEEVLVYVDVSIGAGKTGRIGIHKGDNPKTLATNFARTYSLNATMKQSLEKLLESYIASYFAQAEANKQQQQQPEVAAFDIAEGVKTEEESH